MSEKLIKNSNFQLYLFSLDTEFIRKAVASGVHGIIVDWENQNKGKRQAGADTEINKATIEDLRRVRNCTDARVICRINGYNSTTTDEIENAIDSGADEILLPMVRSEIEVEKALNLIAGRCGLGILVETIDAVNIADKLSKLPLTRVYVGLNDLGIERRTPNIFSAIEDGTVEKIRGSFEVPFGFAGIKFPECGYPIQCRLLMAEMTRLNCDFSFLRRSFNHDIKGKDLSAEVPRILESINEHLQRTSDEITIDKRFLDHAILNAPDPSEWRIGEKR